MLPILVGTAKSGRLVALEKLQSDWTTGANVYWQYERAQRLGIDYDVNKKI